MAAIDIHEARTHLSRLVDQAANGESLTIAKAGKPMVRVVALDAPVASKIRRLRFMAVQIDVPKTSIAWVLPKSQSCSAADPACNDDEAAAGYTPAALDHQRTEEAFETGPEPDRRSCK